MVKEIVTDEAVLSQVCEPAGVEDAEVAADLVETLKATEDAAALAANQIGEAKCIVAYFVDDDEVRVLFNPKMQRALGAYKTTEGCLSREGETKVTRYNSMRVVYQELADGELKPRKRDVTGWEAQLIQHMIDHCKGKLV